jgi:hypothetical protein
MNDHDVFVPKKINLLKKIIEKLNQSNLLVHKVDYHDQLLFVNMVKLVIVSYLFLVLNNTKKKEEFVI